MREQLKEINNLRGRFRGTVAKFGTKPAYKGAPIKTVLLRDVKDSNDRVVTDHLWFVVGVQFESLKLVPGDEIQFDARVTNYRKGYRGRRDDDYDDRPPPSVDYRLSRPTKVRKVADGPAPTPLVQTPEGVVPTPRMVPRPNCSCSGWPGPREANGHHQYCRRRMEVA